MDDNLLPVVPDSASLRFHAKSQNAKRSVRHIVGERKEAEGAQRDSRPYIVCARELTGREGPASD